MDRGDLAFVPVDLGEGNIFLNHSAGRHALLLLLGHRFEGVTLPQSEMAKIARTWQASHCQECQGWYEGFAWEGLDV